MKHSEELMVPWVSWRSEDTFESGKRTSVDSFLDMLAGAGGCLMWVQLSRRHHLFHHLSGQAFLQTYRRHQNPLHREDFTTRMLLSLPSPRCRIIDGDFKNCPYFQVRSVWHSKDVHSFSIHREQKNPSLWGTVTQKAECPRKHSTLQQHWQLAGLLDSAEPRARSWRAAGSPSPREGTGRPLKRELSQEAVSSANTLSAKEHSGTQRGCTSFRAINNQFVNVGRTTGKRAERDTLQGFYVPPYLA